MLRLQATAGPCEGTSYSKAGNVLTVGRTRASKVHIKDPAVSEKHAELRWEGGHWTVTDVGSSNGTAINNKSLEEGKPVATSVDMVHRISQTGRSGSCNHNCWHFSKVGCCAGIPVVLKDGDTIQFGSDSLLAVQMTPVVTEHMTVEQHLSLERELVKQRIMVQCCNLILVSVHLPCKIYLWL